MNATHAARNPVTPTLDGSRRSRHHLRGASRRIGLAATVTALSLLPIAPSSASAAAPGRLTLPQVVQEAVNRAQQEHPGAQFYGADAVLPRPTSDPKDVQSWWVRFRARDTSNSFQYKYATDGRYQATQPWKLPLGIKAVSSFKMTEEQAHALALEHGHTGQFKALYFGEPVTVQAHPTYWFCIPGENQTVAVDTVTHDVTTPWDCP